MRPEEEKVLEFASHRMTFSRPEDAKTLLPHDPHSPHTGPLAFGDDGLFNFTISLLSLNRGNKQQTSSKSLETVLKVVVVDDNNTERHWATYRGN